MFIINFCSTNFELWHNLMFKCWKLLPSVHSELDYYVCIHTPQSKSSFFLLHPQCNTTLCVQHHTVGLPEPIIAPPPPDPKLEESAIQDLAEKELASAVVDEFMLPKKKKRRRPVCLLCLSVSLFVLSASLSVPLFVLSASLSVPLFVLSASLSVCMLTCLFVCSLAIFYMTLCSLSVSVVIVCSYLSVCCMSLPLAEHNVWGVWCCCTRSGGECRWWEGHQRWVGVLCVYASSSV